MNLRPLLLLLSGTLLPAAFAQATAPSARYLCANGQSLEISYRTSNIGWPLAELHLSEATLTLPQVPSSTGALYRNERLSLLLAGGQATFTDGLGKTHQCSAEAPPGDSRKPSLSSFIDIVGSVSYRSRIALPADAQLIIRVRDTGRRNGPARLLAEQRIGAAGQQVPLPFATSIDRDLVDKKSRVTVSARIEHHGKSLFVSQRDYPVLVDGQPRRQDIELHPVVRARSR